MSDEKSAARLLHLLSDKAPQMGFGPEAAERLPLLALFLRELQNWRGAADLVGRLSEEDLAVHALESALGARLLERGERLLDIGSGAGFPGVPLAIFGAEATLLEPRQRRAAFLRHLLRTVQGLNAVVRVARVEHLTEPRFDAASVRAVGKLSAIIGEGGFLKEGGKLLIWTAGDGVPVRDMVAGGRFRPLAELPIPGARSRRIVALQKCSTGNAAAARSGGASSPEKKS